MLAAGAQIERTTRVIGGRKNTVQHNEDTHTIEALLKYGADVRVQDHHGNTCLHQACAWGNLKTARVLVQAGADPLRQNSQGWRPDAYSLTVQADVYFRNLVAEFERRKAEELAWRREQRPKNGGGGNVRLVQDQEDDSAVDFYDATDSSRSRASSGKSTTTSDGGAENGLGINVSGGNYGSSLKSSEAWV